jgi:hypothetical protein
MADRSSGSVSFIFSGDDTIFRLSEGVVSRYRDYISVCCVVDGMQG